MKKKYEVFKVKNDLEKAQALLANRKYKLKTISEEVDIPYITIKTYSRQPDKLRTAAWIRVNKLARVYDRLRLAKMYDGLE